MPSFSHHLDQFLTSCRESTYAELQKNKQYADLKTKQSNLRSELEMLMSDEANKLFSSYLEKTSAILSMEANNIMMCGLTLTSELQKCFDTSTSEYKAFAKEYL